MNCLRLSLSRMHATTVVDQLPKSIHSFDWLIVVFVFGFKKFYLMKNLGDPKILQTAITSYDYRYCLRRSRTKQEITHESIKRLTKLVDQVTIPYSIVVVAPKLMSYG